MCTWREASRWPSHVALSPQLDACLHVDAPAMSNLVASGFPGLNSLHVWFIEPMGGSRPNGVMSVCIKRGMAASFDVTTDVEISSEGGRRTASGRAERRRDDQAEEHGRERGAQLFPAATWR